MSRKKLHIKLNNFNSLHADVETYFDAQNNAIHILDRHSTGMTVTNSLEFYLRPHILKYYNLTIDNVRWIIYHTDGFLSEFIPNNETSGDFVSIKDNNPIIYQPFMKIIEDIREVVGYLDLFKGDVVTEVFPKDDTTLSSKEKKWYQKFDVVKRDLLEVFCGIESKDEERNVLSREIRKALNDGYGKVKNFTEEKKEVIIGSITVYICSRFGLPEAAVAFGVIRYIITSFANIILTQTHESLCEGFDNQVE